MPSTIDSKINSTLWDTVHWKEWIRSEIDRQVVIYKRKPKLLIGDHKRETGHARDYHGREILELLQNADDAGADYGKPNRVKIVLMEEGLLAANTGVPFNSKGLESLMTSDTSPKQLQRTKFIGNKGLGFRSVLGWTANPFILSGGLSIFFSKSKSKLQIEELCRTDVNIKEVVEEFFNAGNAYPIVAFSFPFWLT